jgi:hypothetical protein
MLTTLSNTIIFVIIHNKAIKYRVISRIIIITIFTYGLTTAYISYSR